MGKVPRGNGSSGNGSGGKGRALESLRAPELRDEMTLARRAELEAEASCCSLVVAALDGRLRGWMADHGVEPPGSWGDDEPQLINLLERLEIPRATRGQMLRVVGLIRGRARSDAALGARFRDLLVADTQNLGRPGRGVPLSKVELLGRLVPETATVQLFDGIRDATLPLSNAQLRDVIARLLPPRKRMKKAPSLAKVRGAVDSVLAAGTTVAAGDDGRAAEPPTRIAEPTEIDIRLEDADLRRRQQRVLRGRMAEPVFRGLLDALTDVATAYAPPPMDSVAQASLDHAEALRIGLVSLLTRLHPSRAGTGSDETLLFGWDPEHPPVGSPDALIRVRCASCSSTRPIPWEEVLEDRLTQDRLRRGEIPEVVRLMLLLEGEAQCAAPSCRRRAAHGHHIDPQRHGKNHDPSNIVFLCVRHHLSIVECGTLRVGPGWEDDQLEWLYPDGTVVVTERRVLPAFAGRNAGEAATTRASVRPASAGEEIAATVRARSPVLKQARQLALELQSLLAAHLREQSRRERARREQARREQVQYRQASEPPPFELPEHELPDSRARPELFAVESSLGRELQHAGPRLARGAGGPVDHIESISLCVPPRTPRFEPLRAARRAFTRYGECATELAREDRNRRDDGLASLGYTDLVSLAEGRHQLSPPELSERRRIAEAAARFPSCGELFREHRGGVGKKKMLTLGRSELEEQHDSILAAIGPHVTARSFERVVDSIEGRDECEPTIEWELPLPAETHSMFRRFARLVGRVLGCCPTTEQVVAYLVRSLREGKWVEVNGRPAVAVTLGSTHSMEVRHGPPRHASATYQCDCCEMLWQHDEDGQVLYPTLERQQEVLLFAERVRWLPREVDCDPAAFDVPRPHPQAERAALERARGCSVPGCPCAAWDPLDVPDGRYDHGPAVGLLRALPLATLRAAAEAARAGNVRPAAPDPESRQRSADELICVCAPHLWQIVSGLLAPRVDEEPASTVGGPGGTEASPLAERVRWLAVDFRAETQHQRRHLPRQHLAARRIRTLPVDLGALLETVGGRPPPG